MVTRRKTRTVRIGDVAIGSDVPVSVQSMTTTHTEDVTATVAQIKELEELGCQIVRVAVPTLKSAQCISEIKRQINIPLVADIHFRHILALEAIQQGADKIRVNPGNMKEEEKLKQVVLAAKEKGIPIRIGVNSGSIRQTEPKIDKKDTPLHSDSSHLPAESEKLVRLMVDSVLKYCEFFESLGFRDIVLSLKASDCLTTMEAYREVAQQCSYPLHLGITAAGPPSRAVIKSAIGIGGLLSEGIGDTIRVSLTGPPHAEVEVGHNILKSLGLEKKGLEIVSCPTCGRCEIDLTKVVEEVEQKLSTHEGHLQVAIMGCVVNGPGEAREADIGIAGGKGFGFLFRQGEKIRKVPEECMVQELLAEIEAMTSGK